MSYPILYSFKRCPYAMRARMALHLAEIKCEIREIRLSNKPEQMLEVSPKGTVPILILEDKVIDVLVENLTEDKSKAFGRSEYMTSVIFNGKKNDIGKIVQVKIKDSNRNTLFGEAITNSDKKVA